jgi:nicotinate-nucleotide--dimethylbenzimidazole phosphoribosyltransferase
LIPSWVDEPVKSPDDKLIQQANAHQLQLTKPPGSLGRLEVCAVRLCALQQTLTPQVKRIHIAVFAADHGVAVSGVSAFPQEVTNQMVANFSRGGAAISVLAKHLGAHLEVVDVGTACHPGDLPGVVSKRAGDGTANLAEQDAMSAEQLAIALEAGRESADRALEAESDLFIGGDMGIANTTPAAALGCALTGVSAEKMAGPGTGLDAQGVNRKAEVIQHALARYEDLSGQPLEALRVVGGFEIAALSAAYLRCAQIGLPVIVDGFIATAAALVTVKHQPKAAQWLLFSHRSAEPGHRAMLESLGAEPLLQLDMRLGEGSGAAVAVPLLQMACELHNGMATFAQAGVSEG